MVTIMVTAMIHDKRSIVWICILGALVFAAGVFGQGKIPATYLLEGQMLDREVAVNGQCQFRAELWDQKAGYGARIGPVQVYDVNLVQGQFRIRLNERREFGPSAFRNQDYWLEPGVSGSQFYIGSYPFQTIWAYAGSLLHH